jgi:universal stress protein E
MLQAAAEFGVLDAPLVTVMHAFHPPYEGMLRHGDVGDDDLREYRRGWRDHMSRTVRAQLVAAQIDSKKVQVIVPAEHPVAAIRAVLDQQQPELLVIGASRWFLLKRVLFGSVADAILRSAACDVLVIPSQKRRSTRADNEHDATACRGKRCISQTARRAGL